MALFQQGMFQINPRDTPETIARKRALANQIMNGPAVAPRSTADGIGNAFASIMGGIAARNMNSKADAAERAGQESAASAFNPLLDAFRSRIGLDASGFPAAPNPGDSTSMATMPAPDTASARVAQAHGDSGGGFNGDLRSGIIATAEAIGADPLDLATAISYETAGTFDPTKRGPRTQWGQHRGLIQFGEPQARQHGVDWNDPIGSQLGPNGAIASYFRSSGFKPGMSGLDLYSTINAGAPGRYSASDANNGGAPGNVRDKWENQMAGHRQKAAALLGSLSATPAAPEPSNGLTPDALQQWAFANYAPQPANGAVDAVNALGNAQPVGVAETEADILAQEQAMMGQAPQTFQQPQGTMAGLQAPEAAPPMPPAQFVQDRPVQAVQTPQDRGFPEMAGNNPQAIPAPGIDMQAIANVLTNPFSSPEQRSFAQMLLEQEMQSRDPMRQMQLEKGRLELDAMRNPVLKPTDTQRNLEWRAQQAGLQPGTPEYADFMARGGQLPQQTTVNNVIGGEQLTPGQKKIDESFADTYLQWMGGGWADSAKQIEQLTESLDIIERAAKDGSNISGAIGALPSSVQPFVNPQGTIAREGVEEVVQRSLREILGAQFTEKEGERLIARAYNPMLPAAENAKRVRRLLGQVQGMAQSRQEMVDYFDENGTLRGFKGKRPNASQVDALAAEWAREDSRAGREMEPEVPDGVDPSDWEFMTPDDRRLWQQ